MPVWRNWRMVVKRSIDACVKTHFFPHSSPELITGIVFSFLKKSYLNKATFANHQIATQYLSAV